MTSIRNILLVMALVVFVSGCDSPPAGPRTADGKAVEADANGRFQTTINVSKSTPKIKVTVRRDEQEKTVVKRFSVSP